MNSENGNASAYPCDVQTGVSNDLNQFPIFTRGVGLTKREAFAMAAMQGFIAADKKPPHPEIAAEQSVRFADALLAELAKEQT